MRNYARTATYIVALAAGLSRRWGMAEYLLTASTIGQQAPLMGGALS